MSHIYAIDAEQVERGPLTTFYVEATSKQEAEEMFAWTAKYGYRIAPGGGPSRIAESGRTLVLVDGALKDAERHLAEVKARPSHLPGTGTTGPDDAYPDDLTPPDRRCCV